MNCRKGSFPAFDPGNPAGYPFAYASRAARQAHPVFFFAQNPVTHTRTVAFVMSFTLNSAIKTIIRHDFQQFIWNPLK